MLFDNHSHTEVSSDSDMKLLDAISAARKIGLGLVLTEHFDYDYIDSRHYKDMDFRFDPKEYWQQYGPYRDDTVQLGVEIGLSDTAREANEAFLQEAPFDLVIGSIHMIDLLDLYYPDFYQAKSKEESYTEYLQVMADMLRDNTYIDVLGHIDYICRYTPYDDQNIVYEEMPEAVDEVLRAVLDTGKVMELNTRRLGDRAAVAALMPIYRRYQELGGRYITLGSDAHAAENIGMNFHVALDMAEALKLRPVTFSRRRMKYC